jgi:hypothetical protein
MGFNSLQGQGIFLFSAAPTSAKECSQPPTQRLVKSPSQGTKQQGVKLTTSPIISVNLEREWSYTSMPLYVFIAWCLPKHRHQFIFSDLTKFLEFTLKTMEWNTQGWISWWPINFDHWSFVQPFCSCIQQPHNLNKVQYPADTDVIKVTGFMKCWPRCLKLYSE